MSKENGKDGAKRRVAIVGAGVSGLSAAWHLHQNAPDVHVEIFEAEDRLGGHAYTMKAGDVDVDIGFMVYNESNYPNMIQWFDKLGVEGEDTDMSFAVSLDQGKTIEWNSDGLNGVFARRSQLIQPSFYTMILDMMRFHKEAYDILKLHDDDPRKAVTVGQYLRDNDYSEAFGKYYLLPLMAALWSASMEDVLSFPAAQLIAFFCNHKMLNFIQRPQWKTPVNRSQTYTLKLKDLFGDSAHVSSPIVSMKEKSPSKSGASPSYELFTTNSKSVGTFDEVIFACHPPTAKKIVESAKLPNVAGEEWSSADLLKLLDSIEYADNVIYVHSDPNLMPKRKHAWASWNCLGQSKWLDNYRIGNADDKGAMEGAESAFGSKIDDKADDSKLEGENGRMKAVYATYWLNRLQNLDTDKDIFVSLNPHQPPAADLTYKRANLAHPQFKRSVLEARKTLFGEYQGKRGLWFCGAWGGYGFHEDGCRSGFDVATKLSNVPLPWADEKTMVLPGTDLTQLQPKQGLIGGTLGRISKLITRDIPVALCKQFVLRFLKIAIKGGCLQLKLNDGTVYKFGDGAKFGCDSSPVTMRIFDEWVFVKIAWEYDLGLARSYVAGHFNVEALNDPTQYNSTLRPLNAPDETTTVLGDPIGLTRLFLLFLANRDRPMGAVHKPRTSARGYSAANAVNAGLLFSKLGSLLNFIRYRLTMGNSERGGSVKNIHAHYDLSNDLFTSFLDKETLMYSSAIYDAVRSPTADGLVFRGTLEEAQWRKLDTLLDRAQIQPGQTMLDIGFGWGGLSLHAAKKYGCKVVGITLSVEQKALAEKRVAQEGVGHLVTFEVVDYRTFARRAENRGKFDRVLSCEMIEAVGHEHLTSFYWAVEQVLAPDGILVMEAITTTEARYEGYISSTDFINTIIFPGGCAPSLHALVDAAYKGSTLSLEHIDNIGLHYAQTLAEWRRRFNANEAFVRQLGFDDIFLRVWNYYLSYCEAGFFARSVNCLIVVFGRHGCKSLTPLHETRALTQQPALTDTEVSNWIAEGQV